jgi:PhnB protein
MKLNPLQIYLEMGNGRCAPGLARYAEALGAKRGEAMAFRDSPMTADIPAESLDRIMHTTFTLSGTEVMACDQMPGMPTGPMQGFSLSLHAADDAAGKKLYDTLAEGGTATMPFGPVFWGGQSGMVTDRFGTPWMVSSAT